MRDQVVINVFSDISNLARDAALAPVRECSTVQLATIRPQDIRQIQLQVRHSHTYSHSYETTTQLTHIIFLILAI